MTGLSSNQSSPGNVPSGALTGVQLAEDVKAASPGLPDGIWRDAFLEIMIEAHRRDMRASDQCVLRFYATQTRARDWSDAGRGPICYVGQINTAERLGFDRKTVYSAERRLEKLGLIQKTALANGHRRGPKGSRIVSEPLGICFAPAIRQYQELKAMVEFAQTIREDLEAARFRVSGLRAKLRIALRDAPMRDRVVDAIQAALDALPNRIARIACRDALVELEGSFQNLLDDLGDHLSEKTPVENVARQRAKSSQIPHEGGQDSPRHSYTTTNSSFVSCTQREGHQASGDSPCNMPDRPNVTGQRLENRPISGVGFVCKEAPDGEKPRAPVNWTFEQLNNAATKTFQSCMAMRADGQIKSEGFVDAAADMAAILGINQSAWSQACNVMGRFDAALAVLILDRNRTHPTSPVHSPGGALRAMTNRARSGDLNIDASIFAILRRAKREPINLN